MKSFPEQTDGITSKDAQTQTSQS
ncbi:hypothetical protein NPIL_48771, partial [Nephila pilipes]